VSAVAKDPRTYEHIDPALVGNRRHIVVSDQAGRANILARLSEIGIDLDPKDPGVNKLVEQVKAREFEGFAYDGAEASFELLARRARGEVPTYFSLARFRIMDDRRWNAKGELVTESEATVTLEVAGHAKMEVADGNGPVNALDTALRKALVPIYPQLQDMRLVDYKVRILTPQAGTRAVTRVMIESADANGRRWTTIGVSTNIIDASFNALHDGITWKLFQDGASVPKEAAE
jgi:2-isopropylmalate synthase